jgi:hypothetical protein
VIQLVHTCRRCGYNFIPDLTGWQSHIRLWLRVWWPEPRKMSFEHPKEIPFCCTCKARNAMQFIDEIMQEREDELIEQGESVGEGEL